MYGILCVLDFPPVSLFQSLTYQFSVVYGFQMKYGYNTKIFSYLRHRRFLDYIEYKITKPPLLENLFLKIFTGHETSLILFFHFLVWFCFIFILTTIRRWMEYTLSLRRVYDLTHQRHWIMITGKGTGTRNLKNSLYSLFRFWRNQTSQYPRK